MLNLYVEYSSNVVGHTCSMWQAYLLRAYVNNVKCMYTRDCGDILYYIEFIWGMYADISASYVYISSLVYVAYLWHLRSIFVSITCMDITWKIKVAAWFFLTCMYSNVGLCVNYIIKSHDQKSCCISFWPFWPEECNDAIDDAVGVM